MAEEYSDDERMPHGGEGTTPTVSPSAKGTTGWSSALFDVCCDDSTPADHFYSCFCPCCSMAVAKHRADQSGLFFNMCCFPFCCTSGVYSLLRIGSGIEGTAWSDCAIGAFLPWCAIRQLLTESRLRPNYRWVGNYNANSETWNEHMGNFNDCRECGKACCCPCVLGHEIHTKLQVQSEMPTHKYLDYCCILPCSMYGQTRLSYGIQREACWEDFCCGGFFYPCGLNRAIKEVGRRELTMRQRAYAAGVGAAGKSRQGIRVITYAAEAAVQQVAGGDGSRSLSRMHMV